MKVRVKAGKTGYFGMSRRKEGSVFEIEDEAQFSEFWMERLDAPKADTSEPVSSEKSSEERPRRGRPAKTE